MTGEFRIGEQVTIRIPRLGEFPAQIRWALPGRAGARFARKDRDQAPALAANVRGAAAIEYALVASLIALALVAAIGGTGKAVGNNWNDVDTAVSDGTRYER